MLQSNLRKKAFNHKQPDTLFYLFDKRKKYRFVVEKEAELNLVSFFRIGVTVMTNKQKCLARFTPLFTSADYL